MTSKKSKNEIIFVNALLCLMVVFIHVSSAPVTSLQKSSLQYLFVMIPWRLSAFVVQGFIFLSSLKIFIKEDNVTDYTAYYLSRFKKIVVPYIIWVVIYYLYFCKAQYFPFSFKHLIKEISLGTLVSPFYFIIVIVQFYALVPLWQKVYRKANPCAALVLSLCATLICGQFLPKIIYDITGGYSFKYNDRIFTTYLLYWSMGAICGINYEKFTVFLKNNSIAVIAIFILFGTSDAFFSYKTFALGQYIPFLETLHVFYCVSAILLVTRIGLAVKPNMAITAISSISYSIYLSHCFVMFNVNKIIAELGITSIGKSYAIRFITVYSITISGCLLYKYLKSVYFKKRM